jgi:hypothetical protein
MAEIKVHLNELVSSGEPPLGFSAADVISAAHRSRRRRRGGAAAIVGAVGAVAAVTAFVIPGGPAASPGGPAASPARTSTGALSLTALTKTAASRPADAHTVSGSARVNGLGAAQVIAATEKTVGAPLVSVQASILPPSGELDLGAAVGASGGPYVNVQVSPAHTLITATPTCAELSDLASGSGDGYYGPCSISRLPDGDLLISRSGHLVSNQDAMAQATLIRPDGSGIFAEDTNTAFVTPQQEDKLKAEGKGGTDILVVKAPPAGSAALVALVRTLAADQS